MARRTRARRVPVEGRAAARLFPEGGCPRSRPRSDLLEPLADPPVDRVPGPAGGVEPLHLTPGGRGRVREWPPQDPQRPGVELRAVRLTGVAEDDDEAG